MEISPGDTLREHHEKRNHVSRVPRVRSFEYPLRLLRRRRGSGQGHSIFSWRRGSLNGRRRDPLDVIRRQRSGRTEPLE